MGKIEKKKLYDGIQEKVSESKYTMEEEETELGGCDLRQVSKDPSGLLTVNEQTQLTV